MSSRIPSPRIIANLAYLTFFSDGWGGRIAWSVILLWLAHLFVWIIITVIIPSEAATLNRAISPIFEFLIFGIFYSVLMVRCHRFTWMQEPFGSLHSMFPTGRDWRFFGVWLALFAMMSLPLAIGMIISSALSLVGITTLLGFIGSIWVGLRMVLALPIVALDSEYRVSDSWGMTKGHAWKIFLVFMMSFAPFFFTSSILIRISGSLVESNPSPLYLLALILTGLVVWLFVIGYGVGAAALTLVFKELSEPHSAT